MARLRQSSCHLGHALSPANVRYNANGSQECVVCARRRSRDWQRSHRAHQPIVDDKSLSIALVVWRKFQASWTFHRTREAAAELAPTDAPYSIVDIARKPWIHHQPIPKGTPMTPKELQRLTDAAIAAVGDRQMTPHPHGLAGRVADAHREAEEAMAIGDIDTAIGASMLAAALTDAALCEHGDK